MTQFCNLSPHDITLIRQGRPLVIPPSGQIARVRIERRIVETLVVDGEDIVVEQPVYGAITGLPDPQDGVIYLASRTIVDQVRRPDVLRVDEKVRDRHDRIVGVRQLATYPIAQE